MMPVGRSSGPRSDRTQHGLIAAGLMRNVIINLYWWAVGHSALQSAVFSVVMTTLKTGWMWTVRPRSHVGVRESTPV